MSTDCAASMLIQTLDSKYRGGEDYYDDEDGEGADAIDSFLKNLPEILVSVIIIMIAYFVWSFFNSPTGSALGNAVGELVGMLTDMMQKWQFFLLAYAVIAFIPLAGRGLAFLVDRFDKRATSNALKKYNKMQNDSEMSLKRSKILADLNKNFSNAYTDLVKQKYTATQADQMIRAVLNHQFYVEDPNNPDKFEFKPLSESLSPDLEQTLMDVRAANSIARSEGIASHGDIGGMRSEADFVQLSNDRQLVLDNRFGARTEPVRVAMDNAVTRQLEMIIKVVDQLGIDDINAKAAGISNMMDSLNDMRTSAAGDIDVDREFQEVDVQRQALKAFYGAQDDSLITPGDVNSEFQKRRKK